MSYSREDQKDALLIVKALEQAGYSVWWDGLLEGGERFAHTTEAALTNANAVVVLWSKTSIESHWVHDEATRGRDNDRLVPLSLDGSDPPLGFGQFQCIDVSQTKTKSNSLEMQKMLRAVDALNVQQIRPEILAKPASPVFGRRGLLVGGTAVAASIGGFAVWKTGMFTDDPSPSSIAVLPFINLSGDPEQAYFSDGLASEIRAVLSRNKLLQIMGQASSNIFRDREIGAKSIAEKLGVSFLLDGNVQKAGDMVKITTDLTDGVTGLSKWTETFARPLVDIFALQSEIASAVASALSLAIDAESAIEGDQQNGGTKSVAAFDAYLRGKDLFELHVDEASERAALAKFNEAIKIDPEYAAPRAARSRALTVIANQYVTSEERIRLYDEAIVEAEQATQIAPEFAAGYNALGYAHFYGRLDVKGAREPYERAYSLAKSDVDIFSRYAIYQARTGKFAEANRAIEQASKLDPLNASMFKSAGVIKFAEKKYDEANARARQALEINPKRNSVYGDIGNAYLFSDRLNDAKEAYRKETNNLIALPGLATIAHREGRNSEAQTHFDNLVREYGDNGLYQQVQVLAQWGEIGRALIVLKQARQLRDSGLVYLLNDPFLDPLRNAQEFGALLSDLGFS
ncbi:MAG: TIR domain-containing protein [Sphingorhabdus sp.]